MRKIFFSGLSAIVILSSFEAGRKPKLKLPREYVLIPAGSVITGGSDTTAIPVQGFYISRYEITNEQYAKFYAEASPGLQQEQRQRIAVDTAAWAELVTHHEPLTKYYYSHPSFNNYPVVNIPHEGALAYCTWLQAQLQRDNPHYEIEVKLPSKWQWIYAAEGGRSQAIYAWGNGYLRNKRGAFLCSFRKVGDEAIFRNRQTGQPQMLPFTGMHDRAVYTSSIDSFYPNPYGLYNMCGNVAELVSEPVQMGGSWNDYGGDVQIRSESPFVKRGPTVGFRPVVMVKAKG